MRGVRVGAAVLVLGGLLAACGDDGSSSDNGGAAGSESPTRPEDLRVSDAEAAEGIQQIDDLVDEVAAAVAAGDEGAAELDDQIHPVWESVEGTVQENDPDAYITFEDNFALLTNAVEDGDAEGAQNAAETVSDAAAAYLAEYPG